MEHCKNGLALAMCAGLAISATARAQFAIVSTQPGSFTDISGSGALIVTGDDATGPVTVSSAAANAAFPAGTVGACTNGHVGYGTDITYVNSTLPSTFFYAGGRAAAVYWDDLITNVSAAGVYSQEVMESGVPVLIIEWVRMDHYSSSPDQVTFEIKIFGGGTPTMGTGPGGAFVQFIYPDVNFGDIAINNGASATIGYQISGVAAEQWSYNTASIMDGSVLSLVPGVAGACCLPTGTCAIYSSNNCANAGGTYRGDGSTCAAANCPSGACCLPDASCVISASAGCAAQSGVYRGDGTSCATTVCPSGGCCLPNGSCVITAMGGCAAQNGVYGGDGSTCATACPTGACCTASGCIITTSIGCTTQSGTFHGAASTCAQAGCPQAYQEQGDAGDLPSTAQVVAGSGPLPGLLGSFSAANDTDMYQIQICNAANFSANTVNQTTATFDTQLFLFDSTGHGVVSDDDDPQGTGGLRSRLSSQFIPGPGLYYLAITCYNQDPHGASSGGLIWANTPFNVERRPDGPAAAEAIGSWDTSSFYGAGNYLITFTGTCYVGSACYANCDGSTGNPFLTINDFVCFQSKFAAGDPYANCDGSTGMPLLTINDYVCFQTKFAAGCSAP